MGFGDKDEEGAKVEKVEEVEKSPKGEKKRKAKAQPIARPSTKKGSKPSLVKLNAPTRETIRATTLKAKE